MIKNQIKKKGVLSAILLTLALTPSCRAEVIIGSAPPPQPTMAVFITAGTPELPCDASSQIPAGITAQMAADFAFVKSIQGSQASKLHTQLFGAVNGSDYLSFFKARVRYVDLSDCGGGSGVVACADNHYMYLTPNYTGFNMPQIGRIHVVFHEARHAGDDNGGWPHAICPTPFKDENGNEVVGLISHTPMAGKFACDKNALGAYGTGLIMLKNIQKFCSNCNGKVKEDAGMFADDDLKRLITPEAIKMIKEDLYK